MGKRYKVFGLILCVCIATFSLIIRTSSAETREEIRFRDFEWGGNYNETALKIDGLDYPLKFDDGGLSAGQSVDQVINKTGTLYNAKYRIHGCASSGFSNDAKINVAGYTTREIYLYYAFPVENGVILASQDDARFYCGEYCFVTTEPELMIKDLKEKMSVLYGQCDGEKTKGDLTSYYWYGANKTVAALVLDKNYDYLYSAYNVKLIYGWYGGDDLLEEAYKTYFSETGAVFATPKPIEASTDEHIKFMDMDWRITKEEFEAALTDKGLKFKESITSKLQTEISWRTFLGDLIFNKDGDDYEDIPYYKASYESANFATLVKVAGYEVSSIDANFAPSLSKSSLGRPYILMNATYSINGYQFKKLSTTIDDAYADLYSKLSNLYGTPVRENEDSFSTADALWLSSDKTAVRLTLTKHGSTSWIDIEYGDTGDEEYLLGLFEKIHGSKPTLNNSEDYDGL